MGSSKPKPKPSKKKPSKKPSKQQAPESRAVAKREAVQPAPASLGDVVAALRAQQAELARIAGLLEGDAAARALLAQQTERILELQQRTNTLLELALGAAFDFELEGPRPAR